MINIDFVSTIRALADIGLPAWDQELALYIPIEIRVWHGAINEIGKLHLLLVKQSNYLTLWTHHQILGKGKKSFDPIEHDWGEHVCHHDSEWLSSIHDEATDLYFKLCEKANSYIPPVDFGAEIYIGGVGARAKHLRTNVQRDKNHLYFVNVLPVAPY